MVDVDTGVARPSIVVALGSGDGSRPPEARGGSSSSGSDVEEAEVEALAEMRQLLARSGGTRTPRPKAASPLLAQVASESVQVRLFLFFFLCSRCSV